MSTPLYPTFKKRIEDGINDLIQKQITPWCFLTSGNPFCISKFDGKQISYQGIGFGGSSRHVFWSRYIEPFLEHLCISEINEALLLAKEKQVNAKSLLPEIQSLLSSGFKKVYRNMADVDRRLRGQGFPSSVKPRNVKEEVRKMNQFLSERIQAEIDMWEPPSFLNKWYEKNKFWVWAIGIFVALLGIFVAALSVFSKKE